MESKKRTLQNYVSPSGADCFHDWITGVKNREARQAFRIRLNRVGLGNFGNCRPVGEGVHELRFDIGPGYRIYFGEDGDTVVLLGGGEKSTQDRDIKTAKWRWSDYNA